MKREKYIRIGTSGWHYDHWIGPFYPEKCKKKDFLQFYRKNFDTAEINNSFYQLPKRKTFGFWRDNTPDDFIFSVKASRYITHMKKLKDPKKSVAKFFQRVQILGDKLGPILFQLPPRWKVNPERLDSFLKVLPEEYDYTFELRDPSWFTDEVIRILTDHNAAFCIYNFNRRMSPKEVTADFVYIRLHGPKGAYEGQYTKRALSQWSKDIIKWKRQKRRVYCYFDNDQAGYAPRDAGRLVKMVTK